MNDAKEARALETSRAGRNEVAAPAVGKALVPRKLPVVADRRFLPADLEILETPPSPVRLVLILVISALVVSAIAWAYYGRIDIIASAQGKLQPTGRVKVIEPVQTGRVAAIHAINDSQVKAGDILVELDRSAAEADVKAAKNDLASALAEALRRQAELKAVWAREFSPPQAVAWPDRDHDAGEEIEPPAARMGEILPSRNRQQGVSRALRLRNGAATLVDIGQGLRAREERVLAANLGQLASIVASFDAQLVQKTTEREMLEKTIATQKNLVATLQERVDMRTKLVSLQSGAKSAVIDATETLQYQQTQLAMQQAQLASVSAGLDVIRRDSEKAVQSFLSDDAQKLDDAERRAEDASQRLAKAVANIDNLTLRAPIAGRVQSSIITNIGQVVTSGQEIMRIVPQDSKLEIEAYVLNRDIGFVSVGQEAVVKLESFPFTRYGSITAHVKAIAKDAIPAPDASAIEGDPAHASTTAGFAGAERAQNLVFAVELEPQASTISVDGVDQPLTSGMAVTVELKTGARRLFEYIFSPLVETASRAMRER